MTNSESIETKDVLAIQEAQQKALVLLKPIYNKGKGAQKLINLSSYV